MILETTAKLRAGAKRVGPIHTRMWIDQPMKKMGL